MATETARLDESVQTVAYRNPDRPDELLCREHGDARQSLTPLAADDLPYGGICTHGRPTKEECGRDVLTALDAAPNAAADNGPSALREELMQDFSNEGAMCGTCGDEPGDRTCPDCERARAWYADAALARVGNILEDLAGRWQKLAEHSDASIGAFEGLAAAARNTTVAERGRTYRKAAADLREVLRTGLIPHDLLTEAEERQRHAGTRSANHDGSTRTDDPDDLENAVR